MEFLDGLQRDVGAIDQESEQWILSLLFDLAMDLQTDEQLARSVEIMQHNLAHPDDWIVLNNSMQVLHLIPRWRRPRRGLRRTLASHARRAGSGSPET